MKNHGETLAVATAFWCCGWAAWYAALARWEWAVLFGALTVHNAILSRRMAQ